MMNDIFQLFDEFQMNSASNKYSTYLYCTISIDSSTGIETNVGIDKLYEDWFFEIHLPKLRVVYSPLK